MSFFNQDFLNYFTELSVNNNREWFQLNKTRFHISVEKPFLEFLEVMIDKMRAVDSKIAITPKDAIFRIYRDTRFSADKTPYKNYMAAVVSSTGRKGPHGSGAYFHANHEEFSIYGGAYMPGKEELQNIREKISADLTGFDNLINQTDFKERFGGLHGEVNKRIPTEFDQAALKQPLLFNKSFYFFKKFPPAIILKDDLPEICMEYYLAGKPIGDFFGAAIEK